MLESDKFVTVPSVSSHCIGRQRLVGECVHKIVQIVVKSRVLWSDTEERLSSRTFNFELDELSTLRALVHGHLRASPTGDVSSPLHIDVSVASPTGRFTILRRHIRILTFCIMCHCNKNCETLNVDYNNLFTMQFSIKKYIFLKASMVITH